MVPTIPQINLVLHVVMQEDGGGGGGDGTSGSSGLS